MIASLAAIAAPVALAGMPGVARTGVRRMIVSGRVSDAAGRPRAGVAVEIWPVQQRGDSTDAATRAITDADGRFFATLVAAAAHAAPPRRLTCRIDGERIVAPALDALERDDTGTWRASFGVTLA